MLSISINLRWFKRLETILERIREHLSNGSYQESNNGIKKVKDNGFESKGPGEQRNFSNLIPVYSGSSDLFQTFNNDV